MILYTIERPKAFKRHRISKDREACYRESCDAISKRYGWENNYIGYIFYRDSFLAIYGIADNDNYLMVSYNASTSSWRAKTAFLKIVPAGFSADSIFQSLDEIKNQSEKLYYTIYDQQDSFNF